MASHTKFLWIGELDKAMDEDAVRSLFAGEEQFLKSVKIVKDKVFSYGFIEFISQEQANRVLAQYNGRPIPHFPGRSIRLERFDKFADEQTSGQDNALQFSVFVSDLSQEVSNNVLLEAFQARYPSATSAKVVMDTITGASRGYGYVRFSNEQESLRATEEMNGVMLSGRPIKLNTQAARLKQQQQQQQDTSGTSVELNNPAAVSVASQVSSSQAWKPSWMQQQQQQQAHQQEDLTMFNVRSANLAFAQEHAPYLVFSENQKS